MPKIKNGGGYGAHDHFTIPKEHTEEIINILSDQTQKRNKSNFIVKAILEKHQRETQKTMSEFETPQTELDFLPRVNEPLTRDHLKQLSNHKELTNLMKMMYYNQTVIKDYFDSIQRRQSIRREYGV